MTHPSVDTIRVAAVDRQAILRYGLHRLVEAHPACAFVGEAHDRDTALRLAKEQQPDVLLLGTNLPGPAPVEVAEAVFRDEPEVNILVLNSLEDARTVFELLAHRVAGILTADEPPETI